MTFVHDPTLYEMHFVAIPPPREGQKFQAVCDFVNQYAVQFAESLGGDPPPRIDLEDYSVGHSDRLASVGPTTASTGTKHALDIRTIHDTVLLRATGLREGGFSGADGKGLALSAPQALPSGPVSNYLGRFRILYVESDEADPAARAAIGKALAAEFDWPWLADAEPIRSEIGTMLFGQRPESRHRPEAPSLDMIFVGGPDPAANYSGFAIDPLLMTLPELALCHLKIRNSTNNLRFEWLTKLSDRDQAVRDVVPHHETRTPTLAGMLARNDDLTTRQAELVDAVCHVQAELRSMRINRDNFTTAASARPFDAVADKLRSLLIDRWMRGAELQAENDIGFGEGTLRRADTYFKSIDATAEVAQAGYLKWINWWVILLGGVQVAAGLVQVYFAWSASSATPSTYQQPTEMREPAPARSP